MDTLKPRSRSDVITRDVRNQRVLYDNASHSSHVLNETAEFIWNLCDGEHSVEEIALEVRASFEVPPDIDLEADILNTLRILEKKGLLLPEGAERGNA